jgi:serine/threonine protein kinase
MTSGATVALKIVRSADPELARRLAQEVRALARVDHPSMVRLLASGQADGQSYLVMEMIDGPTLAEMLRDGPLGTQRTARLGAQLADALSYVHRQGVVHRDVKPSNILMSSDGNARLSDFGVACLLDDSTLTLVGTTLGTAAYMAPEQLESHQVGAHADVWSLGMVLLECLTGHRVYEGTPSEVVAKRMAGDVPLPEDLPAVWRLLLRGMLDQRPLERLDSSAVAALLATSPYSAQWRTTEPAVVERTIVTATDEATKISASRSSSATLLFEETQLAPLGKAIPAGPSVWLRFKRRWRTQSVAMVIAGVLIVGLFFGLVAHSFTPGKVPNTSTSSSTTSIAPTTTSLAITGSAALESVLQDISTAVSGGTLNQSDGQSIAYQSEQAISDAAALNFATATNDLQQALTTVSSGVQNGTTSAAVGTLLRHDLTVLATALGLSGVNVATTTTTTFPSGPGYGHGHGNGNGPGQ